MVGLFQVAHDLVHFARFMAVLIQVYLAEVEKSSCKIVTCDIPYPNVDVSAFKPEELIADPSAGGAEKWVVISGLFIVDLIRCVQ